MEWRCPSYGRTAVVPVLVTIVYCTSAAVVIHEGRRLKCGCRYVLRARLKELGQQPIQAYEFLRSSRNHIVQPGDIRSTALRKGSQKSGGFN